MDETHSGFFFPTSASYQGIPMEPVGRILSGKIFGGNRKDEGSASWRIDDAARLTFPCRVWNPGGPSGSSARLSEPVVVEIVQTTIYLRSLNSTALCTSLGQCSSHRSASCKPSGPHFKLPDQFRGLQDLDLFLHHDRLPPYGDRPPPRYRPLCDSMSIAREAR